MRGVPSGARPGVGERLGNCLNVTVCEIGNGFIGVAAHPWPRVAEAPHRAQPVTEGRMYHLQATGRSFLVLTASSAALRRSSSV